MGIVKVSSEIHENIRVASKAMTRSINAQAEHWMKVGMLAERNPGFNYGEILSLLLKEAEQSNQPENQNAPEVKARRSQASTGTVS
ncbi:ParD-like family protein [Kiloniella sp. EL199]|uniref:ParD-like family protein n=1 Tax=Kiloniella sp. EL199 TaxID=2107581 RepID=UPI000EA3CB7B|nr:ParD-like family protein [Kiloniella sp. EL199]